MSVNLRRAASQSQAAFVTNECPHSFKRNFGANLFREALVVSIDSVDHVVRIPQSYLEETLSRLTPRRGGKPAPADEETLVGIEGRQRTLKAAKDVYVSSTLCSFDLNADSRGIEPDRALPRKDVDTTIWSRC